MKEYLKPCAYKPSEPCACLVPLVGFVPLVGCGVGGDGVPFEE